MSKQSGRLFQIVAFSKYLNFTKIMSFSVRFRFCSTLWSVLEIFSIKNLHIIFTWRIWSTLVRNFWWDMGGRQSLHSIGSYCWTKRMQIDLILVNYEVSLPKNNSEKSNNTLNRNKMQRCVHNRSIWANRNLIFPAGF